MSDRASHIDPQSSPGETGILASSPAHGRTWRRRAASLAVWSLAAYVLTGLRSGAASAQPLAAPQSDAPGDERGTPTVKLDALEFPAMLGGKKYERFLRKTLAKEVRRVDWGASSDSTIEYRFFVTKLNIIREDDAIVVRCAAMGKLPRGRSAKSQLSFGGDPRKQSELVRRVLRIVARGVVTRLAEMERVRRGKLKDSRVITPPS